MPSPEENKTPSPSIAPLVDKDFWHAFKDVVGELSTSVLSSICFYDISSTPHYSLQLLLMTKDTLHLHLKRGSGCCYKGRTIPPEAQLQSHLVSSSFNILIKSTFST